MGLREGLGQGKDTELFLWAPEDDHCDVHRPHSWNHRAADLFSFFFFCFVLFLFFSFLAWAVLFLGLLLLLFFSVLPSPPLSFHALHATHSENAYWKLMIMAIWEVSELI